MLITNQYPGNGEESFPYFIHLRNSFILVWGKKIKVWGIQKILIFNFNNKNKFFLSGVAIF